MVLRTVLCAAAGAIACPASKAWALKLLKDRDLKYFYTKKQEWLTALCMVLAGGIMGLLLSNPLRIIACLLLLTVAAVITRTDCSSRIIPNQAVLAVFGLKLVLSLPVLAGAAGLPPFSFFDSFVGLAACFVLFSLPDLFGKNVGAGDIKLAASMGFLLGIYSSLYAVVIMGMLIVFIYKILMRTPVLMFLSEQIPMGPFIAAGMLAVYTGSEYLSLMAGIPAAI